MSIHEGEAMCARHKSARGKRSAGAKVADASEAPPPSAVELAHTGLMTQPTSDVEMQQQHYLPAEKSNADKGVESRFPPCYPRNGETSESSASTPVSKHRLPLAVDGASRVSSMNLPTESSSQRTFFPMKVFQMLQYAQQHNLTHVMSWNDDGTGFKVYDIPSFTEHIIPKFFRQTQYKSFLRQLSMYGFHRVNAGPLMGTRYHDHFRRDKPHMVYKMKPIHRTSKFKVAGAKQVNTRHSYSSGDESDCSGSAVESLEMKQELKRVPIHTSYVVARPLPGPPGLPTGLLKNANVFIKPIAAHPSILPSSKKSSSTTISTPLRLKSNQSILALSSLLSLSAGPKGDNKMKNSRPQQQQNRQELETEALFFLDGMHNAHNTSSPVSDNKIDLLAQAAANATATANSRTNNTSLKPGDDEDLCREDPLSPPPAPSGYYAQPPVSTKPPAITLLPPPTAVTPPMIPSGTSCFAPMTVERASSALLSIRYLPRTNNYPVPMAPAHLDPSEYPLSPPVLKALLRKQE